MKKHCVFYFSFIILVTFVLTSQTFAQTPQVIKWRVQSCITPGTVGYKALETGVNYLHRITQGQLKLEVFAPGALVPEFEKLGALRKGMLEGGFSSSAYYVSYDPGFAVFAFIPVLFKDTRTEMLWLLHFGGEKLVREASAKYNVYYVRPIGGGREALFSKKPLRSLSDFKGLKVRTPPGLTSMIFSKLGASPVNLPAGEIYTALSSGVVDAAEMVSLTEDYDLGFHEVAKYFLFPSFHSMAAVLHFEVNMEAWNKLPDHLKAAVEAAMSIANENYDLMPSKADVSTYQKLISRGNVHNTLSHADMQKLEGLAKAGITSILDFLKATKATEY
jgi:TRAP-type mannitol/chloroaromatic compound transport system substrate-binding protein